MLTPILYVIMCNQFSLAFDKPESDGIYALQDNGGERYDAAWFGENDSDAESVDSEEEDSLRYILNLMPQNFIWCSRSFPEIL